MSKEIDAAKLKVTVEATTAPMKKDMERAKQITRSTVASINKEMDKVKNPLKSITADNDALASVRRFQQKLKQNMSALTPKNLYDGFKGKMKDYQVNAGIKKYTDEFMDAENEISKVESALKKLRMEEEALRDMNADQGMSDKYRKVKASADKAQKSLDGLLKKKKELEDSEGAYVFTPEYNDMVTSLSNEREYRAKLREEKKYRQSHQYDLSKYLFENREGKLVNLEDEFEKVSKNIDQMEEKIQSIKNQGKHLQPTEAMKKLGEKIEEAKNKLGEYKTEMTSLTADGIDHGTEEWVKNQQAIAKNTRELEKYSKVKENIEKSGKDVTRQVSLGRQALNFGGSVFSLGKNAALKGWGGMTKVIGGLKSAFSKVISVIRKTSGVFGALIQKFKTGLSRINPFNSGLKKTHSTMGGGLKNILKYTIGIRSLFVLFNRLRSAAVEGFQNLAQYSDTTNRSISMLMSSFTQLKNSVAAAFAPVLNVVAPILDTIIQKIISVMNVIGQLTSALTGSSTYIRAKKVNQDYAASLDSNTSSAKNANKANKELQKTLLGFDQINKMDSVNDSDSDSGLGSNLGGISANDMFETLNISNKVNSLAQKIKGAWKNADFTEIGAIVGRKLNSALASIPWEGIQSTANRIAKSLATFLNGFLEEADWWLVGNTIAQGLNTALGFANTFAENFHWGSLGNAIGNGINGALAGIDWETIRSTGMNIGTGLAQLLNNVIGTIDWSAIGTTVSNGINTAFLFGKSFVETFDWNGVGLAVSTGINSALGGLDWSLIKGTLHTSVSNIISSINTFIQTADWNLVGNTIGQYWNSKLEILKTAVTEFDWIGAGTGLSETILGIINTIDYAGIGQAFSDGLKGLLDFGITALQGIKWSELGEKVKEGLASIDWNGVADKTFELIGSVFGGLAGFISGLFGDAVADAKQYIIDHFTESGKWTWEGFKKGVTDMVTGIGTWIKDHIFTPFINGFKSAFGINSPSTVMEEQGGFIIEGLLNGLENTAVNVINWFKELPGRVLDSIGNAKDWLYDSGSDIISGLKNGINDKFSDAKEWIDENIVSKFTGFFKELFGIHSPSTVMEGFGVNVMEGLENGMASKEDDVLSIFETIKGTVSEKWDSIKENTEETWGKIKSKLGSVWDWLTGKSEDDFPEIQKNAEDSFNSAEKTADSAWGNSSNSVSKSIFSMKTETSTGMQQVFKNVESYMTSIYNTITNKFKWAGDKVNILLGDTSEDIRESLAGMNTAVQQQVSIIGNSFANLGTRIQNSLGGLYNIGQNAAQSFANGFRSVHIATPHINVSGYNRYQMGNSMFSTPKFNVQWYASGGFPNAGELFMARENGPELVGRMGNKNTVANNSQIVDGIKAGVYQAVREAFSSVGGKVQGKNTNVTVVLEGDAKGLFKVVRKEGQNYQKSTGKPVFE